MMDYKTTCRICGRQFYGRDWRAEYCSRECQQEADRLRARNGMRKLRAARQGKILPDQAQTIRRLDQLPELTDREREKAQRIWQHSGYITGMLEECARHGNGSAAYWKGWQESRLDLAESGGYIALDTVNGISIYEDQFPQTAAASVRASGAARIITGRIAWHKEGPAGR